MVMPTQFEVTKVRTNKSEQKMRYTVIGKDKEITLFQGSPRNGRQWFCRSLVRSPPTTSSLPHQVMAAKGGAQLNDVQDAELFCLATRLLTNGYFYNIIATMLAADIAGKCLSMAKV